MEGDIHGVRIVPRVLDFKDAVVGVQNRIQVSVKNVSRNIKEIRYWPPTTKVWVNLKTLLSNLIIFCVGNVKKWHMCRIFMTF